MRPSLSNPRRFATRGAALLVAVALAISGVLAVRSARWWLRSFRPLRAPLAASVRAEAARLLPTHDEVSFRTGDGLTLRGWYVPSRTGAAVVLVHGGNGDRASLLHEAHFLSEHGYGVLTFDRRANGESDGDMTSWGAAEVRDVAAALDFVASRRDVTPSRIGVVGFSIGSSAVAMEASHDARARAVVLLATWPTLEAEVRYKARRFGPLTVWPALWAFRHAGIDVASVRPVDAVASIAPRPLLMVVGSEDLDTPPPVMQRVFDAAGASHQTWVVPGAHHGDYADVLPAEYASRIVAFFDESLRSPVAAAVVR